jgi:hypothetical protein
MASARRRSARPALLLLPLAALAIQARHSAADGSAAGRRPWQRPVSTRSVPAASARLGAGAIGNIANGGQHDDEAGRWLMAA